MEAPPPEVPPGTIPPGSTPPSDVYVEGDEPGIALCPACLAETRPHAHFCHVCLAPLTWYAGTGPLERVWAEAWVLARTFTTPTPRWPFTLVVVLLMANLVLGALMMAAFSLGEARASGGTGPLMALGVLILLALTITQVYIGVQFIRRALRNQRAHGDGAAL